MNEILSQLSVLDMAVTLAALAAVATVIRKVWPVLSKLKDIIDDIAGEPARKGVPARPGLMERMASVEAKVTSADYHSRPNGGSSAYDALMREVRGLHDKVDSHITLSNAERAALRADVDVVLLQKAGDPEE